MSNMQNDTRNATVRYEDPLQTTLLGRLLQLCWLVPSLVLILGLNCLFLVAILRTKKLWRPRFVLPASLCVLDIIQGSLFIPSSVVNIVMGGNSNPVWFCWTQASYFYIGSVCTLSTLTLMAWDRYQAICNAIHVSGNKRQSEETHTEWIATQTSRRHTEVHKKPANGNDNFIATDSSFDILSPSLHRYVPVCFTSMGGNKIGDVDY
ncbi:Src y 2 domains-containing protein [Branchiostoma belcheri]|nr:Src y 2 domains-containing protein [Branchiostoma belcheri]